MARVTPGPFSLAQSGRVTGAFSIRPMPESQLPMRDLLRSDLRTALKAQDRVLTRVLRSVISAMENAEAVEAPAASTGTIGYGDVDRRRLEPGREVELIEAEILERETGLAEYQRVGQIDAAAVLQVEISILRRYLENSRGHPA